MEGLDKEVCRRFPLAEAALRMLDYVCREEFLQVVFAKHHGRSYEDLLTFAMVVRLVNISRLALTPAVRKSPLPAAFAIPGQGKPAARLGFRANSGTMGRLSPREPSGGGCRGGQRAGASGAGASPEVNPRVFHGAAGNWP